jgi:hypothetical protein
LTREDADIVAGSEGAEVVVDGVVRDGVTIDEVDEVDVVIVEPEKIRRSNCSCSSSQLDVDVAGVGVVEVGDSQCQAFQTRECARD